NSDLQERGGQLLSALRQVSAGQGQQHGSDQATAVAAEGAACSDNRAEKGAAAPRNLEGAVRFAPGLLPSGMDPLGFIRSLRTFSELRKVAVLQDTLPEATSFDAESCYVGFALELCTSEDRSRIEGAFEFVRDDCSLEISELGAAAAS